MRHGKGWIGVDLDGTLAMDEGWTADSAIGPPVPAMLERVKAWLKDRREVRIVTARVGKDDGTERRKIQVWCRLHVGQELQITNRKDFQMEELWDDRAVQVVKNTGQRVGRVDR